MIFAFAAAVAGSLITASIILWYLKKDKPKVSTQIYQPTPAEENLKDKAEVDLPKNSVSNLEERSEVEDPSADKKVELEDSEEPLQIITDKDNNYSLKLPADWEVVRSEGPKGVQRSFLQVQSSDWKFEEEAEEGPFSAFRFKKGARLNIQVLVESDASAHESIMEEKNLEMNGVEALMHRYKDISVLQGELLDLHFSRAGYFYLITLEYDPDSFDEQEFIEKLSSYFRFL